MEQYTPGLVSVVMPTYKRSEKLERAIRSVLSQTYEHIELLLVNDNEPADDFTQKLQQRVKQFESDSRFRLVMQQSHKNGAVARNVGIRQARGEYIAFLDDDDWWEADKLEQQVRTLAALPEDWGAVSCRIKRYDNDRLIAKLPKYKDGWVCRDIFMLMSDFATGTLLLRRKALDQTGYFDEALLRHQDLQLLVDFTHVYKLKQVDAFLHCCDISDAQNRPNVEKIIRAKEAFFQSVAPVFETFSKAQQRQILLMNRAEVGYVQLKNRQIGPAIKNLLPLLTSFTAAKCYAVKVINKLRSQKTH